LDELLQGFSPGDWITLSAALLAFIASLVSAFVSSRTFGRYAREQFWIKKAETYDQIMKSLYAIRAYWRFTPDSGRSKEEIEAQLKSYREELEKLTWARVVGSYYISREAVQKLNQFKIEPGQVEGDPGLEVEAFINEFATIAKRDLRVAETDWLGRGVFIFLIGGFLFVAVFGRAIFFPPGQVTVTAPPALTAIATATLEPGVTPTPTETLPPLVVTTLTPPAPAGPTAAILLCWPFAIGILAIILIGGWLLGRRESEVKIDFPEQK
jgi:hypothetical protein